MRGHAAARGGEVMAHRGAVLRVPAARAPGIPAMGGGVCGRGLSRRAPPPPMPGRDRGGGGQLAEEVLIVLVDVELHAKVGVTGLGLGTLALPRQVPRGRRL